MPSMPRRLCLYCTTDSWALTVVHPLNQMMSQLQLRLGHFPLATDHRTPLHWGDWRVSAPDPVHPDPMNVAPNVAFIG